MHRCLGVDAVGSCCGCWEELLLGLGPVSRELRVRRPLFRACFDNGVGARGLSAGCRRWPRSSCAKQKHETESLTPGDHRYELYRAQATVWSSYPMWTCRVEPVRLLNMLSFGLSHARAKTKC